MDELLQQKEFEKQSDKYQLLDPETSQAIMKEWNDTLLDHGQTLNNPLKPNHEHSYLVKTDWGNLFLNKDSEGKGVRLILLTEDETGNSTVAGYGSITQTETSEPNSADITFKIFKESRENLPNKPNIIKNMVDYSLPLLDKTPDAVIVGQRQQSYKGGVEGRTAAAVVYRKAGFQSPSDNQEILSRLQNREPLSEEDIESLAANSAHYLIDDQTYDLAEKTRASIQRKGIASTPNIRLKPRTTTQANKLNLGRLAERLKKI